MIFLFIVESTRGNKDATASPLQKCDSDQIIGSVVIAKVNIHVMKF
jgi:hypothetical protein